MTQRPLAVQSSLAGAQAPALPFPPIGTSRAGAAMAGGDIRKGSWIQALISSRGPRASLLIRLVVGAVFLSEGLLKFISPDELGVGRFVKIGIPLPAFSAPFVGVFEIACGALILLGLLTRLAAVPMIIDMMVAISTTKIPLLLKEGFWKMAHEARVDYSMILGCVFLLCVGAGPWSLDAALERRSESTPRRAGRAGGARSFIVLLVASMGMGAPVRGAVENTVSVNLTEFRIEMPRSLSAGKMAFKVTNTGRSAHSLEIEGNGVEEELEPALRAGETRTWRVSLAPGAYEVYCPVHDHKMRGMSLPLTVK